MEDENEQLDYDELDDLETARKKCKQLQKAVEIDTLQAVKTSSEQQTIEEVKEILTNDSTIKSETVPITSQMQLSSFPQAIPQYTCSTSLFSSTSSVLYSSSTPPPPGVSTVPIIASSFSQPITTNILRPSIQQQPFLNKFYVNPKFNNNKNFRFDKRNMSKTFYTKPIGVGYFPSISALPPTANVLTSQPGGTVQFVGGSLQTNNQNMNVLGPNSLTLPPVLTNNLLLNQQFGGLSTSSSSFIQPSSGNNIYINRSVLQTTNNWNAMVDEFVRKNVSSDFRSRYIPSNQSRSRSSSRSTFRRSNSSSSDSSQISAVLRNRSTSITDDSLTNESSKRRRIEGEVNYSKRSSKFDNAQKINTKEEKKSQIQAIECARAIGLDEDYLKKIEEQQRLRDEVLRRKTQKRKEKEEAIKKIEILTKKSTTKAERLSKIINITEKREESTKKQKTQQPQNKRIKTTNKVPEKIKQEEENISSKLRPYLAVVCTNLRGISNVEKKIGELAEAIGKTKKIWRVGTDDCHIIFEKHEHAKEFMLQYYGKKLGTASSTTHIDIALKKVFLNISSHGSE